MTASASTRPFQLISFESAFGLARSAAEQCADEIAAHSARSPFFLALSGGRIASVFFEAFRETIRKRQIDPHNVHFFWADERCVPLDNAESNFGVAERLLFRPLAISAKQIHRIQGELAPETAAKVASDEILQTVADRLGGQPVLDLVLLGMGEDGHVASLFPNEDPLAVAEPTIYRPVRAPKPPPWRVTLGYLAIQAARQVWVLVSGGGKELALKGALGLDVSLPLGRVLANRSPTRIFAEAS